MISIVMTMIIIILTLLPEIIIIIIIIIKDPWTNFDSQIYCTLFVENDSNQTTKERKMKM